MLPKLLISVGIAFAVTCAFYVFLFFSHTAFIGQSCGGFSRVEVKCFPGLVCKDLVPGLADEAGRCEFP